MDAFKGKEGRYDEVVSVDCLVLRDGRDFSMQPPTHAGAHRTDGTGDTKVGRGHSVLEWLNMDFPDVAVRNEPDALLERVRVTADQVGIARTVRLLGEGGHHCHRRPEVQQLRTLLAVRNPNNRMAIATPIDTESRHVSGGKGSRTELQERSANNGGVRYLAFAEGARRHMPGVGLMSYEEM